MNVGSGTGNITAPFFLNELSSKSRDIFPKSPKITTPLSCSKQ